MIFEKKILPLHSHIKKVAVLLRLATNNCGKVFNTHIYNILELNITNKRPSECKNITDVRNEIDNIDRVVVDLLSLRFEYVKEVVKYKDNTPDSIIASDRRKAVLECRRQWAAEKGLNPDVIEDMYNRLIQYFIDEEMKIKNA